jgi:hypothetical protein
MTRIAVLIVGSLIWEAKPHREGWRRKRLNVAGSLSVSVPIRYGRRSESRENTCTMVFSNQLVPDSLGLGLAVPCRCELNTSRQLFEAFRPTSADDTMGNERDGASVEASDTRSDTAPR